LFRRRSADKATPRVQPSFSSSFDLEDFKGHSRVVESVEGEKESEESQEAMDKKGALERPRKIQRYYSRKNKRYFTHDDMFL